MVHQKGMIRCYDLKQKRFIRQEDFLLNKMKSEDQAVLDILNFGDIWPSTINSLCKIDVSKDDKDYSFHVISFASESGWQRDDSYEFIS